MNCVLSTARTPQVDLNTIKPASGGEGHISKPALNVTRVGGRGTSRAREPGVHQHYQHHRAMMVMVVKTKQRSRRSSRRRRTRRRREAVRAQQQRMHAALEQYVNTQHHASAVMFSRGSPF